MIKFTEEEIRYITSELEYLSHNYETKKHLPTPTSDYWGQTLWSIGLLKEIKRKMEECNEPGMPNEKSMRAEELLKLSDKITKLQRELDNAKQEYYKRFLKDD